MRALAIATALALAACASQPDAQTATGKPKSLPPPPAPVSDAAFTPPEGAGPGGIDYGRWRSEDPARLSERYDAQLKRLFGGQLAPEIGAALQAAGYACRDGNRPDGRPVPELECRIGVMERQCGYDWVVEKWSNERQPRGRFEVMCLGALPETKR